MKQKRDVVSARNNYRFFLFYFLTTKYFARRRSLPTPYYIYLNMLYTLYIKQSRVIVHFTECIQHNILYKVQP